MEIIMNHRLIAGLLSGIFLGIIVYAEGGPPPAWPESYNLRTAPSAKATPATPAAVPAASAAVPAAAATPPKSQFNTQIYEPSPDQPASFTDTVKIVREVQDEIQVFFQSKAGLYTLEMKGPNSGKYSQLLVKSMKKKTALKIEADDHNRRIQRVSDSEDESTTNGAKPGG